MNVDAYLERIRYKGPRGPDAVTLAALQRAHLTSVPFEALDCVRGIRLSVDPNELYDKIVIRKRGGFCFELNGLFSVLLRALGFDVTLLAARPFWGSGEMAPERAHLTLLVTIDEERWLTDVGYGHWTFISPLRLDEPGPQIRGARRYTIARDGEDWTLTYAFNGQAAAPEGFRFALDPMNLEDFAERCVAYSSDPDSPFARSGVYSLFTDDGCTTVIRSRMIQTVDGQEIERPVANDEEWRALLFKHFGVTV